MSSKRDKRPPGAADKGKVDRLAAALRANLKRRKTQARAKGEHEEPPVSDVPPETGPKTTPGIKNP